jgi:hypothetical protein
LCECDKFYHYDNCNRGHATLPLPDGLAGKAGEEAAKVLPEVYKDALQPAAKEVGSALGRAVRIALSPVRALAWSWERAESWLEEAVNKRLEDQAAAPGDVVSPTPQLAAGIIRGVQAAGPEPDPTLRELFANLLTTAMQRDRAAYAHPAFAEILSQLTPDEAKMLRAVGRRTPGPLVVSVDVVTVEGLIPMQPEIAFSGEVLVSEGELAHPELLESYFDNLVRLGLVKRASEQFEQNVRDSTPITELYDREQAERWKIFRSYLLATCGPKAKEAVEVFDTNSATSNARSPQRRPAIRIGVAWPTSFGQQLLRASVAPGEFGRLAASELSDTSESDGPAENEG